MITHTISVLELTWTIVSLIGLIFVAAIFRRTVGDYEYVVSAGVNGFRRYAARTTITIFAGGVITQFAYVAIGVVAMTQNSTKTHITVANWITGIILIAASALSAIFAVVIYRRRSKLVAMIEKAEESHAHLLSYESAEETS